MSTAVSRPPAAESILLDAGKGTGMERQYLIFVVMIFVPREVAHAHTLDTQAILTRVEAAAAAIGHSSISTSAASC